MGAKNRNAPMPITRRATAAAFFLEIIILNGERAQRLAFPILFWEMLIFEEETFLLVEE